MRKGFLICEEMRQYLVMYQELLVICEFVPAPFEISFFNKESSKEVLSWHRIKQIDSYVFQDTSEIQPSGPILSTAIEQMVMDNYAYMQDLFISTFYFNKYIFLFRNVVVGSSTTSSRLGEARPPSQNGMSRQLKVLTSEIDPAESRLILQIFIKGRVAAGFQKNPPVPHRVRAL